ncbi:MAG TPA: cupin domain-containing protein [Ignavibacteria bacterium]|nr:cupin domain-containing protein [Ignavibacteria bacterium]
MKITDWTKQEIRETAHKVDVRLLYETDATQVMHINLKPGEELKPHFTQVDVFFFVEEGNPTIMVGDEKKEVGTNMLVESPKNIVPCLYNYSDKPAGVLVVKIPKPN